MFARIARRYDFANRLLSGGMDLWWRNRLVAAIRRHQPHDVLDLATGSGDVAFALGAKLQKNCPIVAMDFCQPMLDEAEIKKAASSRFNHVTFRQGDCLALPLADMMFDAVTISFGLRNLADRHLGLKEMHRVLRPDGHLLVLEFSQPDRWFRPLYLFYLRTILPRIAGWVTGDRDAYDYLNRTIEVFPGRSALAAEISRAGFSEVKSRSMTFGIVALHEAKK